MDLTRQLRFFFGFRVDARGLHHLGLRSIPFGRVSRRSCGDCWWRRVGRLRVDRLHWLLRFLKRKRLKTFSRFSHSDKTVCEEGEKKVMDILRDE